MATMKTGWFKKFINGISTKVFAISHVKSTYYDYAKNITLDTKLKEIEESINTYSLDTELVMETESSTLDHGTIYTRNGVDVSFKDGDGTELSSFSADNTPPRLVVTNSYKSANNTANVANGSVYMNIAKGTKVSSYHKMKGSGGTTVKTDQYGDIIINTPVDSVLNAESNNAVSNKVVVNALANYGVCSTAATTAAKAVTIPAFALVTGAEITVKFVSSNTATSPTLNVNNTGAKPICYRGEPIQYFNVDNSTFTFRYNGTQYEIVGDLNLVDGNLMTGSFNAVSNNAVATAFNALNLNRTILWTNPNPTAEISTVQEFLSMKSDVYETYDLFLLTYYTVAGDDYPTRQELFARAAGLGNGTNIKITGFLKHDNTYCYHERAIAYSYDSEVWKVSGCNCFDSAGSTLAANNKLIPYQLIGLKVACY